MSKLLSIILPTLNEKENVVAMYEALKTEVDKAQVDYEIIFVDDNSWDGTIGLFEELNRRDPKVKYIVMSRRYGDQACLMAGLAHCKGDVAITMDSDLQHPPQYIGPMLESWKSGNDILVMKRQEAGHASIFKKWSEILFYKILGAMADAPIIYRFAGYALLDRKVIDALLKFEERDPFLRGLIAFVGFRRAEMVYEEAARPSGHSKFSLGRMLKLALTGFTSFSTVPLYLSLYVGLALGALAILGGLGVGVAAGLGLAVDGRFWAILLSVAGFAGLQLCALGLLGVYVGKLLLEVRKRPTYLVAYTGGFPRE